MVGSLIDRWLRELVLISTVVFALASAALSVWQDSPTVIYAAAISWGLAFGGAATLFQTASARAAGESADVAQAMIVTTWNIAIAGGGVVGGTLLETLGATYFPWALITLLIPTLAMAWKANRHGFPST
ncbi:MFS transporter [Azospirillum sp. Sh1]|uniref:MFS transporter n=1 Tax=Azospirillum sp. Sh1 TaxID=2607285 RepID=UPI0011EF677A|nr:MFS transporter [Azospirillum sp. Sh1]KAA0570248.1 MFS transporter [Azospirillum sp. Sh1]